MQQKKSTCSYFQKDECKKGASCPYEHKYEPCPDYDKGFCSEGPDCMKRHIVRKLCMNYVYGFCEEGPDCKMAHVKLFQKNDSSGELKFTEQYYKLLKEKGYYGRDFPDFKPVICHSCSEVGHKSNVCKDNLRISPTRVILCGICETEHQVQLQGKLQKCQFSKNGNNTNDFE